VFRFFKSLPLSVMLLTAADPAWRTTPVANWTEEDAQRILADSPWAKTVRASILPLQTEDERRDGGNMGQERGVGFDGIAKKTGQKVPPSIFEPSTSSSSTSSTSAPPASRPVLLKLRWESALPIRAAELKANEIEPPTLAGDGYRIAVYGVPFANVKGDPKTLGEPLKKQAALKRDGKPDVKPSSVEVFQREDGLVVVYLFPLSAEISRKDERIEFQALIGRLAVTQSFDLEKMQFQGKLEL
jgi:hypothetical protein